MRRYGLAGLILVAMVAGGCQCGTPCNGTTCKAGQVCQNGTCVDAPDGGTDGGVNECSSDVDCAGIQGRTHCDTSSHRCVECIVSIDCPDAQHQVCDTSTHSCAPRPACKSDTDCGDLPGTPYCLTTTGECVTCVNDTQCGGGQNVCDSQGHVCRFSPCRTDGDCAAFSATPHCNSTTGQCQACVTSSQCATGQQCVNGACVAESACTQDGDCAPGERCNTLDSPPDCVQCVTTTDCGLGGRCISAVCGAASACQVETDCGPMLHCNLQTTQCVECLSDAQCAPGQTCDPTGTCTDPASCGPGANCVAGEACTGGTCAPASCTDDALEPNDTPYTASQITPGHLDAMACPNTWDWYVVRATVSDGLVVDLGYDGSVATPTLLVWEGSGTGPISVGQPTATTTGQHLEVSSLTSPGPVWIGVRGGNASLPYTLDVQVASGGLCQDDAYEPNNQSGDATPLPDPVGNQTSIDAIACFANDDWYVLTVPAGMRTVATATATGGGSSGSLVVSLFVQDAGGTLRLVGGSGTNSAEAPASGTAEPVLVRVTQTALGGQPYHLAVSLEPPQPPNDTCTGAPILPVGFPVDGTTAGATDDGATACGGAGSPDVVYQFTLSATRAVSIDTTGALDAVLALQTTCGDPSTEIACHDQPGSTEHLAAVLGPGTYYVWVDGYGGRSGSFTITLTTSTPPPPPANDACQSATVLDAASGGGTESGDVSTATDDVTASCGASGGDAMYTLTLTSAAALSASLVGGDGMSLSLRSTCTDPATETACNATASGNAATIDAPDLAAGTYAIIVDGGGAARGPYTLTWALASPIPPPPNETCATAAALPFSSGSATVTGDTRNATDDLDATCSLVPSGGDVVYGFGLTSAQAVQLSLTADFDAAVELRGSACTTAASSLGCMSGTGPSLFFPSVPSGVYYVVVDGYDGHSGTFSLDVNLSAARPVPANDLCSGAQVVDVSSGSASVTGSTWRGTNASDPGSACTGSTTSGPDVFYAVTLTAGQTLTATATPQSGYDPAIYVLDSCGATSCLAGSDSSFVSSPETVAFAASAAGTYYVVVDGYQASDAGDFTLDLSVQ